MPIPKLKAQEQQSTTRQKLKKPVQLGINVIDLDRLPDYLYKQTVSVGQLNADKILTYDQEKGDERFLVFGCDTLRAAMLIDVLRSEGRQLSTVIRVYIKVGDGSWSKVGFDKVLTESEPNPDPKFNGPDSFVLSSDVFPVEIEAEEYVAPQVGRIEFKRKV